MCERRADEAERESDKLKKAEYMSYHLGEEYEGIISGVTGWGLYVELPNTVEGLVHVNELHGDYYVFNEERMELKGEMSGKTYKLGQKIQAGGKPERTGLPRQSILSRQRIWSFLRSKILTGKKTGGFILKEAIKLVANNKKAYHDYFIDEKFECGIELFGTEVKSIRMGKCSVKEAFVRIDKNEVYIYGMHINPYEKGNIFNKDPLRARKLLMHRSEINKLEARSVRRA